MDITTVLQQYAFAVTFGDPFFIGAILLLAIFGYIMWKLRINMTAGMFIISILVFALNVFLGGIWSIIASGLAIIVFISLAYGLIRLFLK